MSLGLEASTTDHHAVETCFVGREISILDLFERNGCCILLTKKSHPGCYQQRVQKPGAVRMFGSISDLVKGQLHINVEKPSEIF